MSDPTSSHRQRPKRPTRPLAVATPDSTSGNGNGAGIGAAGGPAHHLGTLHLVDPLDVFAGLAAACVPAFCDGLRFDLAGAGANNVTVTYPDAADDGDGNVADDHDVAERPTRGGHISIAVRSEPSEGEPSIAATITCTWDDPHRPSAADAVMARLLADQVLAKIRMESLTAALREQRTRSANLELALATNREIGQAIGILMAIDHLTAAQAFERLRTASQHSHRKLRDIAAEVTETGVLTVVAQQAAAPPIGLAAEAVTPAVR